MDLITSTPQGLYCEVGDFHLDPSAAVARAVITHAHGDHARRGSQLYYSTDETGPILKKRLGEDILLETRAYGVPFEIGEVEVSFHPAGHVLGSAQVRLEYDGEVWVLSGDYKRDLDPTCAEFEVVPCDVFVTEATFGLPIYRWDEPRQVMEQVHDWWQENKVRGRPSVLFAYSLGKAQRLLAELTEFTEKKVYVHGAVEGIVSLYRDAGVRMLPTEQVVDTPKGTTFAGELIVAPPSAGGSTFMRRFKNAGTAFASGWARVRGLRRRRNRDRGFVFSDHADWPALLRTVQETGAGRIISTHGYADVLSRYLGEWGLETGTFQTEFEGEPSS